MPRRSGRIDLSGRGFVVGDGMSDQEEKSAVPFIEGLVGQLAGNQYFIEGDRVVVGRDASQCQIVLVQGVISKIHAAFEVDSQQRVTLVDLSSKQSTFVNGDMIARRLLRNGDRVGFGLGGVVAFIYHSPQPDREQRAVSSAPGISRLVISTVPEPEQKFQRPVVTADRKALSVSYREIINRSGPV